MAFRKITDPAEIKQTMRDYMLKRLDQRAPFLATVFTREHRPGGDIYEGATVQACVTTPLGTGADEVTFTIAIDENRFHLKLNLIEYIEVLL